MKFEICNHCKSIIGFIEDSGVPIMCCGSKMEELIPNSVDAAGEKHVPVVKVDGNHIMVDVGSVAHPMTKEHLISWVAIQTEQGKQRKILTDSPHAEFMLTDGDKLVDVFAYCNLHGLWKA